MASRALEKALKRRRHGGSKASPSPAQNPPSGHRGGSSSSRHHQMTKTPGIRLRRQLQLSPDSKLRTPITLALRAARKRKEQQLKWNIVRHSEPTCDIKVAFERLPVLSEACDFQLPSHWCKRLDKFHPKAPPFVHIRRNVYLTRKANKKNAEDDSMQCSCQGKLCQSDCFCRMLYTSCSSSCACEGGCANLPFHLRPGRRLRLVETKTCGWGVFADENIKAGDFIIEYVGEVLDDKTCAERLWAMKSGGLTNFYLCEVSTDMVIDATHKGNISRFINHSCEPNTQLRKWQINGEVRIGVFAVASILKGQEVTYDYKYIQYGTEQECKCGSVNCKGVLGKKHEDVSHKIRKVQKKKALALSPGLSKSELCIGHRVRVWWPLDKKYYSGRIVHYKASVGKHQILYDDGEKEELRLSEERWKWDTKPY